MRPLDSNSSKFIKGFVLPPLIEDRVPQNSIEDPTYLGFYISFQGFISQVDEHTGYYSNPLFADAGDAGDSAERYLFAVNRNESAEAISEFKKQLQHISVKAPYYFNSIEGLADLWKIGSGKNFDSFRGKDKVITIGCLESLDLRISALAELYRKATFEKEYMREILPVNLRKFSMIIEISEIRKFHTVKQALKENILNLEYYKSAISTIRYTLHQCEFDFDSSSPVDSIAYDGSSQQTKQQIKIKVGRISQESDFGILDLYLSDKQRNSKYSDTNPLKRKSTEPLNYQAGVTTDVQALQAEQDRLRALQGVNSDKRDTILQRLQGEAKTLINDQVVNPITQTVKSKVLGNVYGLQNSFLGEKIKSVVGFDEFDLLDKGGITKLSKGI
jgi:hypothetical protein